MDAPHGKVIVKDFWTNETKLVPRLSPIEEDRVERKHLNIAEREELDVVRRRELRENRETD